MSNIETKKSKELLRNAQLVHHKLLNSIHAYSRELVNMAKWMNKNQIFFNNLAVIYNSQYYKSISATFAKSLKSYLNINAKLHILSLKYPITEIQAHIADSSILKLLKQRKRHKLAMLKYRRKYVDLNDKLGEKRKANYGKETSLVQNTKKEKKLEKLNNYLASHSESFDNLESTLSVYYLKEIEIIIELSTEILIKFIKIIQKFYKKNAIYIQQIGHPLQYQMGLAMNPLMKKLLPRPNITP